MRWPRLKRVDWFVGAAVLSSVAVTWLVLTGIDAVFQLITQIGHIGKNGYTLANAVVYVLVTVPRRLYEMFGFAAMIGGLLSLGGLAGTSELIALRAAGMSQQRIVLSAMGVVVALTVGVVVLGETLGPWGDQQAQAMELRLRSSNLGLGSSSGLWARDGDRIINARSTLLREVNGHNRVELADVRVFTFMADGQLTRFDWAKTATHDGRQWQLKDVRSSVLDEQGVHSYVAPAEAWLSSLDPALLEQSVIHPENLSMRDLRRNMAYKQANGEAPGVYAVAFWGRVLFPFNTLVLVLCVLPFAFGALRSGGLGKRIFLGMLLAIGWYFLQKAIVSFGTVYGIPPLLSNLLPALLLVLLASLYFRRHN